MVFAALISAVDPVATLVTYKALAVEPLLNIMVFGESTINDAVAVVLFNIINEDFEGFGYGGAFVRMTELLFGSMIFGVAISAVLIYLMRIGHMSHHPHTGFLFIFTSAYFIFALAEATHIFSGIIATLMAGIMFGAYARFQFGDKEKEQADFFLEMVSSAADHAVFVLCGASTALISSTRGYKFGAISICLCLFGRACSVIPCGALANLVKKSQGDAHLLSWKHLFMMWHGGLRGGIALVLALEIDAKWCHFKATILNGTFLTICFLLLVNGGTTHYLLGKLGLPIGVEASLDCLKNPNHRTTVDMLRDKFDAYASPWLLGDGIAKEAVAH
jgi:sodium/hydrogen exchanger 8